MIDCVEFFITCSLARVSRHSRRYRLRFDLLRKRQKKTKKWRTCGPKKRKKRGSVGRSVDFFFFFFERERETREKKERGEKKSATFSLLLFFFTFFVLFKQPLFVSKAGEDNYWCCVEVIYFFENRASTKKKKKWRQRLSLCPPEGRPSPKDGRTQRSPSRTTPRGTTWAARAMQVEERAPLLLPSNIPRISNEAWRNVFSHLFFFTLKRKKCRFLWCTPFPLCWHNHAFRTESERARKRDGRRESERGIGVPPH